jgi:S-methylmethionine-dependent homocysteine/selenocysteine methylase
MKEGSQPARITLLDGGMGRELLRLGAPFRQPEWSALALMEAPALVRKAHESFAAAGCDILTTSNYAVVPFHLGEKRFFASGADLAAVAGQIAREVAAKWGTTVAGSLPPLFGSYRPDLFIPERAPEILNILVEALEPYVDFWLAETTSSVDEAQAVAEALGNDDRPLWVSFTLRDEQKSPEDSPRLRSGQKVKGAVRSAIGLGASAILFNCSRPEVMSRAVEAAIEELTSAHIFLPAGVYANAFPTQQGDTLANSDLHDIRPDLDPLSYLGFVDAWCRRGATIIGGCCGIGPEHIAVLRRWLQEK